MRSFQHRANAEAKALKLAKEHALAKTHTVDVSDGFVTGHVMPTALPKGEAVYLRYV